MNEPVDLSGIVTRIGRLSDRIDTKPVHRWATVVTSSPLTIQLDGDPAPLLGSPASVPTVLIPGERVRAEIQNSRVTVLGVAGRTADLRGTTAQRTAAKASGLMVSGQRFYDTTLDAEYVYRAGDWVAVEHPYFIANLNSGKFSGGYGWKVFGTVSDWTVEQNGFGASSAVWWASGVKIPVAGVYLLTGTIMVAGSGLLIVGLKKNNTSADGTAMLVSGQEGGFAGWTSASFATEVRLAAGDLLSFATFTDADYGITNTHTRFAVEFMHA